MARMIDAESLLKKIHDTAEGLADCDQKNAAWALRKYAVRDIMDAETVDAVEVVRCRNCKHKGWVQEPCHGKSIDYCRMWERVLGNLNTTFCSYGERKEGGKL